MIGRDEYGGTKQGSVSARRAIHTGSQNKFCDFRPACLKDQRRARIRLFLHDSNRHIPRCSSGIKGPRGQGLVTHSRSGARI